MILTRVPLFGRLGTVRVGAPALLIWFIISTVRLNIFFGPLVMTDSLAKAHGFKERGNAYFKEGNYGE
jgi:hypothetical protein